DGAGSRLAERARRGRRPALRSGAATRLPLPLGVPFARSVAARGRARRGDLVAAGQGQAEGEDRPLAGLAGDADRATMQAQDVPHDRQPDPGPLVLAARAGVHLVEALKDLLVGLGRDADPRVGHIDLAEAGWPLARRDRDPPPVTVELDRVGQEVAEDLDDLAAIG